MGWKVLPPPNVSHPLSLKCCGQVVQLAPGRPLRSVPETRKDWPVPVPITLLWCGRRPVMKLFLLGPHTACWQ